MLKLNLGCGNQPYIGYTGVDTHGAAMDVCHDIRLPLPFPDGSVDELFASHVVEHFPLWQIQEMLMDWRRVLADDGMFWGMVPDGPRCAQEYLKSVEANDWSKKRIWQAHFHGGWTNDQHTGAGQVHYATYDEDMLREMLSRAHFHPVITQSVEMGPDNYAIVFVAGKAIYTPMDIKLCGVYPEVSWHA